MPARSTILFILFIFMIDQAFCDDKNPVAENDMVSVRVMQTVEIRVLENDFAYDGHPFKIGIVISGSWGKIQRTDTTVIYTPEIYIESHHLKDTIRYNIIDTENELVSDFAFVFIDITNEGFEWLDINRVSCRINSFGLQFWNTDPEHWVNYEVPAGGGASTMFSQSLWIGGKDAENNLHMAAERYRIPGADFYSGPVMDSNAYCEALDMQWHKVWKLSSQDISNHQMHWQDEGYEPVENIAQWPGNGDSSLGQAKLLAPYHDFDKDGRYDPKKGDFPLIKGDQTIFVICNDDRGEHFDSEGLKMGLEVHTLYYAYDDDDSALSYTTFTDQYIINRSVNDYHDVYAGHFVDFDLGYFLDDFLACDTLLESAICYNGEAVDGQGISGEYGEHPPAQSFTCLNYTMCGFVYFLNWGVPAPMQDPANAREYYNYLRGFWRDSTRFTFGGNGYGGAIPVNHIFTGDPLSGTGWTEFDSPQGPGDRRGLITSGPYDLVAGDTIHFEFAFVFARDHEGDNLSSFALLKNRIQQVRDFYENSLGVPESTTEEPWIRLYPNPCHSKLYCILSHDFGKTPGDYFIYDITGQKIRQGRLKPEENPGINTGDLSPGYYLIQIKGNQASGVARFIRGTD